MKKIEEEIKEYFSNEEIPSINEQTLAELKAETEKNKRKKSFWYSFKKFGIASICLLLIAVSAVLIPILTKGKEKYYADDETINSQDLTLEYTNDYISENYPKYEFIFEDYNIYTIDGIYSNDTNSLLAIRLEGEKNDIPFTTLNLCLVVYKNFIPNEKELYTKDAHVEKKTNYTLYKKESINYVETVICGALLYDNYSLYIKVNCSDYEAFEKFL